VKLRAATRASPLARWQTDHVASLLRAVDPAIEVETIVVDTSGDRRRDVPIWEMGGKGVFVKEVQAAVLDGRADIAVHSAKDLPSISVDGLVLGAIPKRGDPRDALIGNRLEDLRAGAVIGTGSVRRRAQLAWRRPDLTFSSLRGNMATRVAAADRFDAVVVAAVALERLEMRDAITEMLEPRVMLPQVAQGALGVECRENDESACSLLAAIDDPRSRRCVDAERAYLAALGGGCDLPAGAHAVVDADGGGLVLDALLASLDGHVLMRHQVAGADPERLGTEAAIHLLDHAGGAALMI
jgi:hydroxymethylbilane synthase